MIDNTEHKEKEVFKVPEGYFEDLTGSLMAQVSSDKAGKKTPVLVMARPHLMLAAAMLAFVIVSYSVLKLMLPGKSDSLPGIEYAMIEDYLVPNLDEVELYELIAQADSETNPDDELSFEQVEEIIDYLIDLEIDDKEIISID